MPLFELNDVLPISPFSLCREEKRELYAKAMAELTRHHVLHCPSYNKILSALGYDGGHVTDIEHTPFLPVRLFKEYELLSVEPADIFKTMTSSGTTGQQVSRIFLDKETAAAQTKVLTKIVTSFTGTKRLPMLVIDSSAVIKDRNLFSARGAGILGFSMIGYDVTYALDERMELDMPLVQAFLEKHAHESILLFGFTFMIWEHLCQPLMRSGIRLPLENGLLIHGGGWKKLADRSVDNPTFKRTMLETCGVRRVYNYYGMVEQTGSIFMECEEGHLHASIFSDIIIRDHHSFDSVGMGKKGIIQLLSLLPKSYPGHSLLSEDVGQIRGEDDCPCGRKGKYFAIEGRLQNAEIRGCSDTYTSKK